MNIPRFVSAITLITLTSCAVNSTPGDGAGLAIRPAKAAMIGDAVDITDKYRDIALQVTLTKVIDPAPPSRPTTGKRFIAARFRMKNNGAKEYKEAPGARLIDKSGEAYDSTFNVGCKELGSRKIRLTSGEMQIGCITFEVDKDAKPERIRFGAPSGFSTAVWRIK
ncbi:DUF4352 domain-containing protein [Actinomadura sp. 6N118]|uniref:DUF4352 domain-containing protein n=1 Tax=Actinomadura sp. 6N118 TaxID=3375151 RepID=UPI0037AA7F66